jgi:hypothetical protein
MRIGTLAGRVLAAGLGLAATAGSGSAQHRQADAHEHGRGTLNIAIEGARVLMELEAPGADIVGFEHEARTEEQKAAMEKAEQQLMEGEALFKLPAAAGCTLVTSGAARESGDHDHAHGAKDDGKGHAHEGDKVDHGESEHSTFRAEYTFECKSPAGLTGILFDYFQVFAGAQRLDVTVITPKGQSRFEVSRANPGIDLGGVM